MATLGIKSAVQLEVWDMDSTARLNETQCIHCVPRTCEVISSVLVDCIMKNRHTGISGNFMPSNFASDSTKMYDKLKKADRDEALSQVHIFQLRKDSLEGQEIVEGEPPAGKPVTRRNENMERVWDLKRCDQ